MNISKRGIRNVVLYWAFFAAMILLVKFFPVGMFIAAGILIFIAISGLIYTVSK